MYKKVLKPILFKIDPEIVHDVAIQLGEKFGNNAAIKGLLSFFCRYKNERLTQVVHGVEHKNPVGLAGGFDKDARLVGVLPSVGFGYFEVGSITWNPYGGNPKPRLKRFPKTKSIWVNYGLKNDGAPAIHKKLSKRFSKRGKCPVPVWYNVAKTNCKETADVVAAVEDYCNTVKLFSDIADVYTINISCPNAYGGQPFHASEDLEMLLAGIDALNVPQLKFLKISPDIPFEEVDKILKVCDAHKVDGIIMSNLRKKKVKEDFAQIKVGGQSQSEGHDVPDHGGLSGKYLEPHADAMLAYVAGKVKRGECNKYTLVGLGGIFTAEDAYKKIRLGASLVQLISGMIFNGPQVIGEINEGLVKLLKKDGFNHISEAVGVDVE